MLGHKLHSGNSKKSSSYQNRLLWFYFFVFSLVPSIFNWEDMSNSQDTIAGNRCKRYYCQTGKILSQETGAMLYQLSYEATHWKRGQLVEFISSREEWNYVKYIWNNSYLTDCGCRWKWRMIIAVFAEVTGSNPVEVLIVFRLLLPNCLNWKIYCDDHFSFSFTTAVHIWNISYTCILHITQDTFMKLLKRGF